MFALTQVLLPVALLSTIVIGLPITEDGNFDDSEVDLQAGGFRFPKDFNERIFGGQEAAIGQFPHQISLRERHGPIFRHNCGGSIITNRFVLTAAHCFNRRFPAPDHYRIVVGAHQNNNNDGTAHNITRWIIHEKFYMNFNATTGTVRNDIALIETTKTIEYNNLVAPIALHHRFIENEVGVVASGWGRSNVSDSQL